MNQIVESVNVFNKAMSLWFELIDMDPNSDKIDFNRYNLHKANDSLKQSMEWDPTLITTYLLLSAVSEVYFRNATFSIHEFDADPDKVFDYMSKVSTFKKLIQSPEIVEEGERFQQKIKDALLFYGMAPETVEAFVANKADLAWIRLDALSSAQNLEEHHFMQGEVEKDARPIYNKELFGYWNVNSLINHVCQMPSGIAVNLLRDPDELHSYFAFSVRNGGNIIMLTDITNYDHPLGRSMIRRADREYAGRVVKNWFPYQLLNIKYDDKGNPYHDAYRISQEKGITPHQHEHFVLSKLADLKPEQVMWLALMFDQINERYWEKPIAPRALSYTNEMIRLEDEKTLLMAADAANLPVVGYQPLALPRLKTEDVLLKNLDRAAIGNSALDGDAQAFGSNQWMEDRYAHTVPEEALNLIAMPNPNAHYFLSSAAKGEKAYSHFTKTEIVPVEGEVQKSLTDGGYFANKSPFENVPGRVYGAAAVDTTLFGTREQLDADRKFMARHNFAKAVQRAADDEFVARRGEILKWYREAIEAREDFIMSHALHETTTHVRLRWNQFASTSTEKQPYEKYQFSRLVDIAEDKKKDYFSRASDHHSAVIRFAGEWSRERGGYYPCYFTEAKPTWYLNITPGSPEDLALLTGTAVDDLPVFLQNWNPSSESYTGNHILNRIDPMEWCVTNPWNQISFGIVVSLSKNGMKALAKRLEPAPLPVTDPSIYYSSPAQQGGRMGRSKVYFNTTDIEKYIKEASKND